MLDLPQVKRGLVSNMKIFVYGLPHKLPNNFRFKILGNQKILERAANLAWDTAQCPGSPP